MNDTYSPLKYDLMYAMVRKWGGLENLKLGLKQTNISPHWLRHSFATHALEQGFVIAEIQYVLGHEKEVTTAIPAKSDHRKNPVGKMY